MDEHALRVLEFDAIRGLLMEQTACSLGREKAEAMRPSDHFAHVQARMAETTECRHLIDARGNLPLGGVTDVRPLIRQTQIGSPLDPRGLLDVLSTATASRSLKQFLLKLGTDFPIMAAIANGLGQFPSLESEISSSISPSGLILDSASPDLARIRSKKRTSFSRMQDRLNGIVTGPMRAMLQDPVIVQRGDRYCVPVKAEHRGAFGGIVHDTSASGATLFMEPQAVVEIGNEIRELEIQERQEEARILMRLSEAVRRTAEPFLISVELLGEIDFIAARAKLAQAQRAEEPSLNRNGHVRLRGARHPLIDPDIVVPIDVELGKPENRLVVITGPNTGGKTVTLKTVGLLTLMAQSGLHVPAAQAELNVFYQVYADIGDEQSLQQSLSTFSGHVANIVKIIRNLRSNALVLLDEVGAGTDPGEGASLARAVLEQLRRADARVIATSHYGELKTYAFLTEGVQNASVEFDEATLSPTYRLLQGVPGSSNAFFIARRLGMPDSLLDEARQNLTGSDDTADLLRELEEGRRTAIAEAREAERARIEAQMLRRRYQEELANLEELRREARQRANEEARALIKRAQDRVENTIRELRRANAEGQQTERARARIRTIGEDLQADILRQTEDKTAQPVIEAVPDRPLKKGDRVRVVSLDMTGEVLEDERPADNALPIQVGVMRVTVPVKGLRLLAEEPVAVAPAPKASPAPEPPPLQAVSGNGSHPESLAVGKAMNITSQITLLGQRADEALRNVEKYLDDAYAAGLTHTRIVHGKGTGALRRAVHQFLESHPLVQRFELANPDEGGAGATIVELRSS